MCRRLARGSVAWLLLAGSALAAPFTTFESGQVRPLALSPDGTRLFAVDTPDGRLVVLPIAQSAGDPTQHGGALVIYDAAGLTPDVVRIALPAAGWRSLGTTRLRGDRFSASDPSTPVVRLVVSNDTIVVHAAGGLGYTLDEPAQGRIAIRLQLGTGVTWCADAPGAADLVGAFTAAPSPAPASCPALL